MGGGRFRFRLPSPPPDTPTGRGGGGGGGAAAARTERQKSRIPLPHTLSLRLFFFNDTATTEIYTLSLHDALPIFKTFVKRRAARETRTAESSRKRGGDARLFKARRPFAIPRVLPRREIASGAGRG